MFTNISSILKTSVCLTFSAFLGLASVPAHAEQAPAKQKGSIYAPDYTPIDLSEDDGSDPYRPNDSIGRVLYSIERFFGMDKASQIATYHRNCEEGMAEFCYKLAELNDKQSMKFQAENFYALACRYGHKQACKRRDKLYVKRVDFERELKRGRAKLEQDCLKNIAASCSKLAYIQQYFGNIELAKKTDEKACELGYPSSCASLSNILFKERNFIASEKYKKKAQDLLGYKDYILEKINGPELPAH